MDPLDSRTIDALVHEIASNRTHGASELAQQSLQNIIKFLKSCSSLPSEDVYPLALKLAIDQANARPNMSVIRNLMDAWLVNANAIAANNPQNFSELAMASARRMLEDSKSAADQIAQHAATLIQPGQCIMTHSFSSTVLKLLLNAPRPLQCIITQGEPGNEGIRLAKELSRKQIPYQYITDAQMGIFVPQADCVIVGADTILADGSLINKAGTYLLALAAQQHDVPFYVCCESFKRSPLLADQLTLESGPSQEIDDHHLPGRRVQNLTFDITPAHLISAYITESEIHQDPGWSS